MSSYVYGPIVVVDGELADSTAANIRVAMVEGGCKLCQTTCKSCEEYLQVSRVARGRRLQSSFEDVVLTGVDAAYGSGSKQVPADDTSCVPCEYMFAIRADNLPQCPDPEFSLVGVVHGCICVTSKTQDGRNNPRIHRATLHMCGCTCSSLSEETVCQVVYSVVEGHWESASIGTETVLHGRDSLGESMSVDVAEMAVVVVLQTCSCSGLTELMATMEDPR